MINWLKRFFNWLRSWKIEIITIGVILFSILFLAYVWKPTESHIRLIGLLLQLAGLCTILYGILKTRELFGLPSLLSSALIRLRAFPRWRISPTELKADGVIMSSTLIGRATIRNQPPPGASIEDRIRSIERNFELLDRTVITLQQEFDKAERSRTQAQKEERAARIAELRSLNEKLELTETGGLDISLGGLVWLAVGLILSTASPELATWFGR